MSKSLAARKNKQVGLFSILFVKVLSLVYFPAPFKSNKLPSVIKKEPRGGAHPNPIREVSIDGDRSQDNYVDSDYVYIQFKNR